MAVVRRVRSRAVAEAPPQKESRASAVLRRRRGQQPDIPDIPHAPMAGQLAEVVEAPNTDALLSEILHRSNIEHRPPRGGEYLHVSDLIHRCMRRRAIEHRYSMGAANQTLTAMDIITFAQGDAIHDVVKDRARIGAPHMVYGKWSCKCENLFHEEPCTFAEIDQEEECPHCRTKVTRYHEVSVFNEEHGIVGNPDLLLYLPRKDAFFINEIKSIAHEQWQELARPKPEHVLQVVFYWYLMRQAGYRLVDEVSVIYITKGWLFGKKPWKEFHINPEKELHRLNDMLEDAKAVKLARTGGPLPTRAFCSSEQSKEAKKCNVCQICFHGAK